MIQSLPLANAILNATSTLLLITGYVFIRRKDRVRHRACMLGALTASVLFLISYLVYHYNVGSVRFTGQGWVRTLYFVVLISHTILAVAIPPLAVITLIRAVGGEFAKHKRIARWTFPIWLYVSFTGVVIYVMLYQWYPPVIPR